MKYDMQIIYRLLYLLNYLFLQAKFEKHSIKTKRTRCTTGLKMPVFKICIFKYSYHTNCKSE